MRRSILTWMPGLLIALSTLFASSWANAERFKAFDHYELHYNAVNTTFLAPEVAKTYAIQRSKVRGLINIALLDSANNKQPVTAQVTGAVRNLVGQLQPLTFRLVREGVAIYYIAEFRFTNDEILAFELQVQPDPNQPAQSLTFKQHFYVD